MPTSPESNKNWHHSILLYSFILISFLSIAGIRFFYEETIDDLEKRLQNQRVRLSVSEQIVFNIKKIESLLFQMAPAANSASYRRYTNQIIETVDLLHHHIDVLQNGGVVRRIFNLNVSGIDQYESASTYKPDQKTDSPIIEVIELLPFVDRIKEKTRTVVTLLEQRDRCAENRDACAQEAMRSVRNFYKELPPFFYRLAENANRHNLKSLLRMEDLQNELTNKKQQLFNLHLLLIVLVIIFSSFVTIVFLRRINLAQLDAETARLKAEEANLAKTRFLATMSHEIRTPMNGILGMVQILEDDELTPTQRRDSLRVIRNSGNTLMQLLNDILDLSKVEAGKVRIHPVPSSPTQLVSSTVALYTDMAHVKGIDIKASSDFSSLLRYNLDDDRIRQMIGNLISNAIKFTEFGEVRVHASLIVGQDRSQFLEFSVEDTGVGIPNDYQDVLFKRFMQVDDSRTRRYDGSGLGLYIVGQFAQIMGGMVGFKSTFGQGSRFWFRIPADEVKVEEFVARDKTPDTGDTPVKRLAGHILVAEDNPINRVIIDAMLKRMGLSTRLVEDAQLAFDVYTASEEFDCILMDVSMPRMSGLESTLKIREWERKNQQPHCPIIAITANAYNEDRQACLDAGMDDFVAKPIILKQLSALLVKFLGVRNSRLNRQV